MCERNYICKIISNIIVIILVAGIMTYMSGCGKKQVDTANMADTSINDSQLVEDKVSSQSMQSEDNSPTMAEEETETESELEDQTEETENTETSQDSESEASSNQKENVSSGGTSSSEIEDSQDNGDNNAPEDNSDSDSGSQSDDNRITICIDPGHGGSNEGTKETYDGSLIKEKNITMAISRKLKYYLEQNDNIRVVMTRNSDSDVSLSGRIDYAASNNADYVISVHINSKSQDVIDASGCMVLMSCSRYQPANARFGSIYDREKSLAYSILSRLNSIGIPIANDTWNPDEYQDGILQRVNTADELYPDGSMADYYGLINEGTRAGIPTIIVEHAFLSNAGDYTNYLSSDAQLDALARADAAGILDVVLR